MSRYLPLRLAGPPEWLYEITGILPMHFGFDSPADLRYAHEQQYARFVLPIPPRRVPRAEREELYQESSLVSRA